MTHRALRFSLSLIGLSGCCAVLLFLSGCAETVPTSMRPSAFSTVVIDAGHGGKDNGGRSHGGMMEKTVTLDTAQRLQTILRREGVRTVMTRVGDYFVELDNRVAFANRYPGAILVSIHYNASPASHPSGVETFFWRTDSFGLATRVERHIAAEADLEYRGVTRRVLRLTHNPRIPSILCECGFLTNDGEAARIATPSFRQRVAEGIADGILEQQERGDAGLVAALPPTLNDSRRYASVSSSRRTTRTVSSSRGGGRTRVASVKSRASTRRSAVTTSSKRGSAKSRRSKH